ncbi:MAG: hypothetical protein AB7Q81_24275 [Gammaproteobacteria bacterium]
MSSIGNLLARIGRAWNGDSTILLPGEVVAGSSERGYRPTPENRTDYLYRTMWVDPAVRASIIDIRRMDRLDPRVKRIHGRTARATVKGGLKLRMTTSNRRIERQWLEFSRRLKLDRREKLESDARGFMMEGNLPMQWVLDSAPRVVAGIRMPSETIRPNVSPNGTWLDVKRAYEQYDLSTGARLAEFALWQLSLVRLTPDNFDDVGAMGRPYLDANRTIWKKLTMTEEDLVIRRRMRAPLRMAHVLEGATEDELRAYREEVERNQAEGSTNDYYLNKKGSVTPVQGDAKLNEIADVDYLLNTFFAGAPAPKGLFGYSGDLNRDILEDLKQDFYEEIDSIQDALSYVYQLGFELDLLLRGINPFEHDLQVLFAERRTETANQAADRALKYQAMGASKHTVFETAGLNADTERERLEDELDENDPYPESPRGAGAGGGRPRVAITPGNAGKGQSQTTISNQ